MSATVRAPSPAYRPLGPRRLAVQLVVLVAAEVALFASYRGHEAGFHWATHFLVGLTAAALLNSSGCSSATRRRPDRSPRC